MMEGTISVFFFLQIVNISIESHQFHLTLDLYSLKHMSARICIDERIFINTYDTLNVCPLDRTTNGQNIFFS